MNNLSKAILVSYNGLPGLSDENYKICVVEKEIIVTSPFRPWKDWTWGVNGDIRQWLNLLFEHLV